MRRGAPHHGIASGFAVMDVDAVDDDVCHKLNRDASSISYVDIDSTPINCFEAVHYEFFLQLDHHVTLEHNPERLVLDNSMTKSARLGVDRVIITGVCNNIESTILATNGISAKTNTTVCKPLAVLVPIGVTTPAVINGISCTACEVAQLPPLSAVPDTPAESCAILACHNLQ